MKKYISLLLVALPLFHLNAIAVQTAFKTTSKGAATTLLAKNLLQSKRWVLPNLDPQLQPSKNPPIFIDKLNRSTISKELTHQTDLVIRTTHTRNWLGSISSKAISPDGRFIVTGGRNDYMVKIWDIASGRIVRNLSGHTDVVKTVAITSDARYIVSGSDDKTVKIWDIRSGRQVRSFKVEPFAKLAYTARLRGEISDIDISPDGRLLAVTTDDEVPRIFDFSTGKERHALTGHSNTAWRVDFSPDGKWLASGSTDDTVKIWDVKSGREMQTLASEGNMVTEVEFSPDGKFLAALVTAEKKAWIRLWDSHRWKKIRDMAQMNEIWNMTVSPNGKHVAVNGKASGQLRQMLYDIRNGKKIREFKNHPYTSKGLFSPNGKSLFTTLITVDQWDVASGVKRRSFEGPQVDTIHSAMFIPEKNHLISTSEDTRQDLWNLALGGLYRRIKHEEGVTVSDLSSDGKFELTGFKTGKVVLRDLDTNEIKYRVKAHNKLVHALSISPDGKWFASGTTKGEVVLWKLDTGKKVRILKGHQKKIIKNLAFSADGSLLASACWDKSVKVWSVPQGRLKSDFRHDEFVHNVAISPDKRFVASVQSFISKGRQIKIWDPRTGELQYVLIDRDIGWSAGLEFTPDGKHLAMGLSDGSIAIWKIGDRKVLNILMGHTAQVNRIRFAPDGNIMVTAGREGTMRLWDTRTNRLLATLISLKSSLDWLVVTPDGLFDGSPAAWKLLGWRYKASTFEVDPIEIFFSEFYYPRLLTDILQGKRITAPVSIAEKDRRQPGIELQVPGVRPGATVSSRVVKVRINCTEAPPDDRHSKGSGVRDLRLFLNGSLIKTWRGKLLKTSKTATFETTIPVITGKNRITAYAFNDDNIKSEDAAFDLNGSKTLKRTGTLYILAVGINQYSNPAYNLRFALPDAQSFGRELQRCQRKLKAYKNIEVIQLINQKATKSNILHALAVLAGTAEKQSSNAKISELLKLKKAQPEDTLIIFFAGHGIALKDRFYLLPHQIGYQGDINRLNESGLATILKHSISDLELEILFEKIYANNILFIIDACNSGQALEAEEKRRGPMNSRGLAQLAYEKGMYILTAAQSFQVALEASELGHGFLTFALVNEGLKTPYADHQPSDGQVWIREWFDYATFRVPEIHQEMSGVRKSRMRAIKVIKNKKKRAAAQKWNIQTPRVFYRRTPEIDPMIIVRPGA
jgi:WD40 repeat protein/uncharacterized caspase-like protein